MSASRWLQLYSLTIRVTTPVVDWVQKRTVRAVGRERWERLVRQVASDTSVEDFEKEIVH
jgi:hypothetical protein